MLKPRQLIFGLLLTPMVMMTTSQAQGPVLRPLPWPRDAVQLTVQANWEITHADFGAESMMNQSEHFREQWQVRYEPTGRLNLITPRGRATVDGIDYLATGYPQSIAIREDVLAALLGVPLSLAEDEPSFVPRLLVITLRNTLNKGEDYKVNISKDEFVTLQLQLDS